jgi:hypothetical protein
MTGMHETGGHSLTLRGRKRTWTVFMNVTKQNQPIPPYDLAACFWSSEESKPKLACTLRRFMRRGFPYETSITCKKEGKISVKRGIPRSITLSRYSVSSCSGALQCTDCRRIGHLRGHRASVARSLGRATGDRFGASSPGRTATGCSPSWGDSEVYNRTTLSDGSVGV